jgi:alpha-glucosidase
VAPVLAAGQTARHVYLPQGDWVDWHTGERHPGRRHVLVPTPMDRIPLFARAGAVVPMWAHAPATTDGHHPEVVELHLFLPEDGAEHRSELQEDDGLTVAADRGAKVRTRFTVRRTGGTVVVEADVEGDGYPEHARERFDVVVRGGQARAARLDGEVVEVVDGVVAVPNTGGPFRLELDV